MNKQRLIILILSIIGVLAVFMPWVHLPIVGHANGTGGLTGWCIIALFGLTTFFCLSSDKTIRLEGKYFYTTLGSCGINFIIALWQIISFNNAMESTLSAKNSLTKAFASSVSIGFGLYVIIFISIAIPVVGYMIKDKK